MALGQVILMAREAAPGLLRSRIRLSAEANYPGGHRRNQAPSTHVQINLENFSFYMSSTFRHSNAPIL